MTNRNNDIEELEELLTELEGQEAQLVSPYSEDDDAVTQLMDAPLGDQEWMVQVTPLDRRMMSTDQLLAEFHGGRLSDKTLVWRGGMDDWLPIQRVEALVSAPRPAPTLASRMAMGLPPPPAARPASQPLWSMPANAPMAAAALPPPPAAMPMRATATTSNMGLPKPVAMAAPASEPMSQTNTTRPVALDFNDVPPEAMSPVQGKRALVALGAVGIMAVFVTFYALSSGGDAKPSPEANASAPQAVAALQPAAAKPMEPAPAPAKVEAAPSAPAPSEASSETESASSETQQKATAPARYSLRSEYRKRSRNSSSSNDSSRSESQSNDTTEERAAPAPRAVASNDEPANEPEQPADDDADSDVAPKSTGKGANTFNREAAKSALDAAAVQAKNCKPPGGPVGTGRVQVRYEPSGKVAQVQLLTGKFNNTTTGSCVQMVFRRAKVPEFTGVPAVVVSKSFDIP